MITIFENKNVDRNKTEKTEEIVSERQASFSENNSQDMFSSYTAKFLSGFESRLLSLKNTGEPAVKVSEVLGGIARLYERIRTTVEYKGEHVLRRNAIERILKRLIWEQGTVRSNIDSLKIARALTKELIWARYLPNGYVVESKVREVETVVEKYVYLLRNQDNLPKGISVSKARSWMWGVASSEIEDVLDPSYRELFVNLMFDWFRSYFDWSDTKIKEHDKNIQIYLAIHRSFPKSDESIMRYHLLLKEYPDWHMADKEEINRFILNFPKFFTEIEDHLNFPGRFILYRKVQKYSAAFTIFHEIAHTEKIKLRNLLEDRKGFEEKIRDVCGDKYKQIKERVSTGIIRSIIYIFLTKVIFAMIIEIPSEILIYDEVRYLPLSVNIIFPPMMMFLIGMSIRIPGAKNTETILDRLVSVIYKTDEVNKQVFSAIKTGRNTGISSLFGILYLVLFILVFGGMTYLLYLLNFSIFGVVVFFFFLSLVMLFAYRVRYNATQLKVEGDRESFFSHLFSYLTLPFLNLGFLLSKGLAKINFFTIILDFLIEVPLKNIIEIFEEWTSFLREKKEEVIEIPE